MSGSVLAISLVAAGLAYANGANDVSKGIATLAGSGVTDYRRAIAWGALWTGAGGVLGAVFGGAMLATFGGGLLAGGSSPTFLAALASLAGAAVWVVFATRAGLPVSTTHALVGSALGVATLAQGASAVRWSAIGGAVFLPLLLSPLVSLLLTGALLRASRARPGREAPPDCLCAEAENGVALAGSGAAQAVAVAPVGLRIFSAPAERCAAERPRALRVTLAHLHWATSGATSLARGMNDAPKIVGLALLASTLGGAPAVPSPVLFAVVAGAMVAGSLLAGQRVTRALAEGVTPMDDREGFAANLVTAALVTVGAVQGLPMSTTHVATGGIFGAGVVRGTLDRRSLRDIGLAWIVTLPVAALLGAGGYGVAAWLAASAG
ncbi:inorganic phosphate transporter [Myxococcota bacterium]|nr:inorganic phosphate transporter [Myxococcota bacterium]